MMRRQCDRSYLHQHHHSNGIIIIIIIIITYMEQFEHTRAVCSVAHHVWASAEDQTVC